ncbi:hypothetical protein BJ742DRAFT_848594 [Cladochytrium replicatum]|nr:hypothetical protein BJ742DRAFT_848594 [Cladochytrium replicatum]
MADWQGLHGSSLPPFHPGFHPNSSQNANTQPQPMNNSTLPFPNSHGVGSNPSPAQQTSQTLASQLQRQHIGPRIGDLTHPPTNIGSSPAQSAAPAHYSQQQQQQPQQGAMKFKLNKGNQWKAKLQLAGEQDYLHLLANLASGSSKLHRVYSQQDFILDGRNHELWAAGLTLIIRYSSEQFPLREVITDKVCTIVLKETLFFEGDSERPIFEVSEREETFTFNNEIKQVLLGTPITHDSQSKIFQDVVAKFPQLDIRCIGSFKNLRHVFDWNTVMLEIDRCTFSFGEGFFCRFVPDENIIANFLTYLQNTGIVYAVNMSSKTSLFFSGLQTTGSQILNPWTSEGFSIQFPNGAPTSAAAPPLPITTLAPIAPVPLANHTPVADYSVSSMTTHLPYRPQKHQQQQPSERQSLPTVSAQSTPLPQNSSALQHSFSAAPPAPSLTTTPSEPPPPNFNFALAASRYSASTASTSSASPPAVTSTSNPSINGLTSSKQMRPRRPKSVASSSSGDESTEKADEYMPSYSQGQPAMNGDGTYNPESGMGGNGVDQHMADFQRKRNREASARYRKRKQQEMAEYREEVKGLKDRIDQLEAENRTLRAQVKALSSPRVASGAAAAAVVARVAAANDLEKAES